MRILFWTAQDLLPKLPPASVVVMNNATFHKRQDTQNATTQAGHTLEYLPTYSPDLIPIEHKWAQAKAIRKQLNKTAEQLFKIELFYVTYSTGCDTRGRNRASAGSSSQSAFNSN